MDILLSPPPILTRAIQNDLWIAAENEFCSDSIKGKGKRKVRALQIRTVIGVWCYTIEYIGITPFYVTRLNNKIVEKVPFNGNRENSTSI